MAGLADGEWNTGNAMDDIAERMSNPVTIRVWSEIAPAERQQFRGDLETVCLEAANRKTFASTAEQDAFLHLWLGHYLERAPDLAFVAVSGGQATGYLVATTADPRCEPTFEDLTYFTALGPQLSIYPAHLHINVAAHARGRAVGAALISAASDALAARGCPGVHVVTGEGARNVGFYLRNGFEPAVSLAWRDCKLIVLGRLLRDESSKYDKPSLII
ncbi:MAG: GNAT family N-acetyltransferase [Pseudomonadota bacterium]